MKLTWILFALLFVAVSNAIGEDSATKTSEKELTPAEIESRKRLDYMVKSASGFEGVRKSDGAKLKAFEQPLLRFTNPNHGCREGLFVGWVDPNNRPVAVGQIFLMARTENDWYLETQSLCDGPMSFTSSTNGPWIPRRPGVEWKKFEKKTSPPAKSKALRLAQMRGLARRFAGEDDLVAKAEALRLMTNPMIRYANEKGGILDGALFTLVQGTDPELLVLLEARKNDQDTYEYWWALAPMTSAKLEGYLDGVNVWTKPQMRLNGPEQVFFMRQISGGVPYPLDK